MNLLLFEPSEFQSVVPGAAIELQLDAERARQLIEVKKLTIGSSIRVGSFAGGIHQAQVLSIQAGQVVLRVEKLNCFLEPDTLAITLIVALPRPQSLKKILQTIAEMGVQRLVLVGAERVEKSYFQSKVLQPEQIRAHLQLGLEQAVATRLPEVEVLKRLTALDRLLSEGSMKLFADTKASQTIEKLYEIEKSRFTDEVVLAIGPEGGWTDNERAWFSRSGFSALRSGERMLRVDTAVSVIAGQVAVLQRLEREKQKTTLNQ